MGALILAPAEDWALIAIGTAFAVVPIWMLTMAALLLLCLVEAA